MGDRKECPCEAVERLITIVEEHDKVLKTYGERLERGNVDFAVINTKLNIVMAVISVVGVAICGAVVALIM